MDKTSVLVMDVEGTDGREKEDQKAFEGKSALFSLALTDVLMVNMWMNEVGRYNAANLPLLKTVFEVSLLPNMQKSYAVAQVLSCRYT